MMMTAHNLNALPHIRHGFFTREGGVSKGIYHSLNCGLSSGDDQKNIAANRARAAQALGASPHDLITARQTHSAEAVILENRPENIIKADALATARKGLALGVLAADCAPVLLADASRSICAAAHAGWRGAVGGITDAAIEQMLKLGARRGDIIAAIGPHISAAVYEIGADMRDQACAQDISAENYFTPASRDHHWHFNLGLYLKARLTAYGVGGAVLIAACTMSQPDRFFSYRASRARGEADYGRQLSAILLS